MGGDLFYTGWPSLDPASLDAACADSPKPLLVGDAGASYTFFSSSDESSLESVTLQSSSSAKISSSVQIFSGSSRLEVARDCVRLST